MVDAVTRPAPAKPMAGLAPTRPLPLDAGMRVTGIRSCSARLFCLHSRRWWWWCVPLLGVLLTLGPSVQSQPVGGGNLPISELLFFSATDSPVVQTALERSRTAAPIVLPESRRVLVITRTQTRPQVCRWFRVLGIEDQSIGQGCRIGDGEWALLPADPNETPPATENALRLAAQPNSATLWVGRDMVLVPLPGRRPGDEPTPPAAQPLVDLPTRPAPPASPQIEVATVEVVEPTVSDEAVAEDANAEAAVATGPAVEGIEAASAPVSGAVNVPPTTPDFAPPLPTRRPEQVAATPVPGVPLPPRRPNEIALPALFPTPPARPGA